MLFAYPRIPERLQEKLRWLYQHYSIPRWMVFASDMLAVFLVFLFAYLLRFNFVVSDFNLNLAFYHALVTVGIYALFSVVFRSYSGLIRHTTLTDIFNVFVTTSASLLVMLAFSLVGRVIGWNRILVVPLSIIIIHYVTITVWLFFVRVTIKILYRLVSTTEKKKKRVLIYGAGKVGLVVKRVIYSDTEGNYHVTGFLDDNRNLQGKKLNGIPVYAPGILNQAFLQKHGIEGLIFGIRNMPPAVKSTFIRKALDLGLEVLETPGVDTWLDGQFSVKQIRQVKLEDLLGRDPIQLNMNKIRIGLSGKTILVTGAAGSIGSELVRQLSRFPIRKLVLVDQAETPVFHLENELKKYYSQCPVQLLLTDVTHPDKMERIFQEYRPEVVFHAAAYKHVPLLEDNPHEALRVNVGGTKNVARLAHHYGVKKFVLISTDKAVNPTNAMGASKRLCEIIVQLKAQQPGNKTQFIITRFGNVLGSNGSVIPIFTGQIAGGGPVTVTHPEITRYFMTIPEACQLVLEAGFMGKGGEIYVFDMGSPVKIVDLAHQMIRLSGLIPEKDIKIVFTGLRPGEKLHEELLTSNENTLPTHNPQIKIAQVENTADKVLLTKINALLANLYSLSNQEVFDVLKELLPEYQNSEEKAIGYRL
jgi:FlaA1/EpsC-like NDP-sugar epimerase